MSTPVAAAGPARLPALDGLRAVAAGMVVLTHAAYLTGVGNDGLMGRVLARGDFGVAIFFALSGYLLTSQLARERQRTSRLDLLGYAARRAARVLPAYWLVLAVLVVLARPSARDAVLHALGLQIYVADSQVRSFGQSWSIATELSFYALLPVAVIALHRLRGVRPHLPLNVLIVALVATSLLGLLVEPIVFTESVALERWLPWRAPHFLVGMILAECAVDRGHRASIALRRLAVDPAAALALAAAAYLVAVTPLAGSLALEPAHGIFLVVRTAAGTILAGGLLLPLVLGGTSTWSSVLSSPVVRWLGLVSYGVFLWHLPVLEGIFAVSGAPFFRGGILPLLIVGVPVTLLLAALSYRWVELPASRLAARMTPRERHAQRRDEGDADAALEPRRAERSG